MQKAGTVISFPPPLRPGGTVGLVSPGRWPKPQWIDATKAMLEQRDYQVVVHAQNYLHDGQLAGSDAARAEALHDMFADGTIDAVLCMRGGTGSFRLLDRLDYRLIGENPKPLIGFSDVTVLLHAIMQQCGFVTYHGPMGWNFAQSGNDTRNGDDLFWMIGGANATTQFPAVKVERAGAASGRLTGGNITLLQYLIGTHYDWDADHAILFIEDVDEALYKLDAKLAQFRSAGKFRGVQAVLVGEMVDIFDGESGLMRPGEQAYGRSLQQIVMDHVPPDVPLAFDFPCGHGNRIATLPIGAQVDLTLGAGGAEFNFKIHRQDNF